jgi:hypothetical protein
LGIEEIAEEANKRLRRQEISGHQPGEEGRCSTFVLHHCPYSQLISW